MNTPPTFVELSMTRRAGPILSRFIRRRRHYYDGPPFLSPYALGADTLATCRAAIANIALDARFLSWPRLLTASSYRVIIFPHDII